MQRLCALEEIADGGLHALELKAADAAIDATAVDCAQAVDGLIAHRCGDEVRLWRNVCPHAGRRLDWAPGRFLRDEQNLVCSHHGAVFELGEGHCISGPCRGQSLTAVSCSVRDGAVWLD